MRCALLPPALLLVGLAGCVDDDVSLTINGFVAVEKDECTADPASQTFVSRGLLDVGVVQLFQTRGYLAAPVVANNIPNRANMFTSEETDAIYLTGFDIELVPDPRDAQVDAAIPIDQRKFTYPINGVRLDPGMGRAAQFVEVIGHNLAAAIAAAIPEGLRQVSPSLTVRLRPVGRRAGLRMVGGYVEMPLDLCKFCLARPDGCPAGGFPADAIAEGGCFIQQDQRTTCCVNPQNILLCGAGVPTETTTM